MVFIEVPSTPTSDPPTPASVAAMRRTSQGRLRIGEEDLKDVADRWRRFHSALAGPTPEAPAALPGDADHKQRERHRQAVQAWNRDMWGYVQHLAERANRTIIAAALVNKDPLEALQQHRRRLEQVIGTSSAAFLIQAARERPQDIPKLLELAGLVVHRTPAIPIEATVRGEGKPGHSRATPRHP